MCLTYTFFQIEKGSHMKTKFIFVTGGVLSSLGKGLAVASLGALLKARGLSVTVQKLDPYLNIDPGTLNPLEHGEVFVTDDGAEADLDLGHYERYLDVSLSQLNTITSGRIYWRVLTIANYVGEKRYETINTTPGPLELNRLLAQMADEGCEFCFMEASSHAIDQQRTEGIHFTGAVFTNLTHDHLDYHKTFANYLASKKKLFDNLAPDAFALTNIDDRNGEVMVQNTKAAISTYSCRNWADYRVKVLEKTIEGMLLNINGKEVWCRFIGSHNAANLTAVYGTAMLLGAKEEETITAMSRLQSVAGRLEYFKGEDDIIAAVDYAHTPDALENVLKTLQELEPQGDLVCVFGCGGNRDKTKRPEMGAIAAKYATRVIVTSDNPRFEDPMEIIADIKAGMDIKGKAKSLFIPDRTEAIRTGILTARPGSIILVAGKGHEDYQIIGGVKYHLDDKEIIKEAFIMQKEAKN